MGGPALDETQREGSGQPAQTPQPTKAPLPGTVPGLPKDMALPQMPAANQTQGVGPKQSTTLKRAFDVRVDTVDPANAAPPELSSAVDVARKQIADGNQAAPGRYSGHIIVGQTRGAAPGTIMFAVPVETGLFTSSGKISSVIPVGKDHPDYPQNSSYRASMGEWLDVRPGSPPELKQRYSVQYFKVEVEEAGAKSSKFVGVLFDTRDGMPLKVLTGFGQPVDAAKGGPPWKAPVVLADFKPELRFESLTPKFSLGAFEQTASGVRLPTEGNDPITQAASGSALKSSPGYEGLVVYGKTENGQVAFSLPFGEITKLGSNIESIDLVPKDQEPEVLGRALADRFGRGNVPPYMTLAVTVQERDTKEFLTEHLVVTIDDFGFPKDIIPGLINRRSPDGPPPDSRLDRSTTRSLQPSVTRGVVSSRLEQGGVSLQTPDGPVTVDPNQWLPAGTQSRVTAIEPGYISNSGLQGVMSFNLKVGEGQNQAIHPGFFRVRPLYNGATKQFEWKIDGVRIFENENAAAHTDGGYRPIK